VVKAPDLAALRAMDPQALTDKAAQAGFLPFGAIDGVVLTRQLVDTFDRGEQAKVPILTGFNSGEIRSLRFLAPPAPKTAAEYEKMIRERYGDLADDFLKLYPATNLEESVLATTRDALYGWTSERLVRSQVKAGQPAFLYLFDHGYPAMDQAGLHAFHASEIPYMFGALDRVPARWPKAPETAKERALSDAMIGYWTSFARTARPRASGASTWKAYTPDGAYMAFRDKPVADTNLMPGMFAFHERAVCRRKAAGDQPWNWNVGLVSPVLVGPSQTCP
jgi:para-nitrobenzyl esterase